jgi:hypothetical protein
VPVLHDGDAAVTADAEHGDEQDHHRHREHAEVDRGQGLPDQPADDGEAGEQGEAEDRAEAEPEPADLPVPGGDGLLAGLPAQLEGLLLALPGGELRRV